MYCQPSWGPSFNRLIEEQRQEALRPYKEGECRHNNRIEVDGRLRCRDCPAIYNENCMEWE